MRTATNWRRRIQHLQINTNSNTSLYDENQPLLIPIDLKYLIFVSICLKRYKEIVKKLRKQKKVKLKFYKLNSICCRQKKRQTDMRWHLSSFVTEVQRKPSCGLMWECMKGIMLVYVCEKLRRRNWSKQIDFSCWSL